MGSVLCRPSEARNSCSPKLNLHSMVSRFSSQILPHKCRNPHKTGRPRQKPRPRSSVLSDGKRPEISPPMAQPVPPPRKKRKRSQDLSRSEETLYSKENEEPATLRPSTSMPTIYCTSNLNKILRNCIDIKPTMASIMEESVTIDNPVANEIDADSLSSREVYFLKKDETPAILSEAKTVEDLHKDEEFISNKKTNSDTFSTVDEKIVKTTKADVIGNDTKKISCEVQKCSDESKVNVLSYLVEDEVDRGTVKKIQDVMKRKWLQSILIEEEPKNIINLETSSNNSHKTEKSDDKSHVNIENISPTEESDETSGKNITNDQINPLVSNRIYENIIKNTHEQVPKLLVTEKCLSETLERLNNTQSLNQENIHNNRNLVFSSEHLNNMNNGLLKGDFDLKQPFRKLELSLEEKLNSNRTSRHSSITESLQEFETSIYDMLQTSAKENISDEDDSLLTLNTVGNNNNKHIVKNNILDTAQIC